MSDLLTLLLISTTASHNFRMSLYRYIIPKNHEMGSQLHLHASVIVCLRYFLNLSFYVYFLWYSSLAYICKIIQNLIAVTFLDHVFPLRVSRKSEEIMFFNVVLIPAVWEEVKRKAVKGERTKKECFGVEIKALSLRVSLVVLISKRNSLTVLSKSLANTE